MSRSSESDPENDGRNTPVVEAVQARLGSLPLSEQLNGTVIAENQVVLYAEVSGKVVRVEAQNGDLVRRGQPLVYLDNSQYKQQIQQAEASHRVNQAALKQAQAEHAELEAQYTRILALSERGLASQLQAETLGAQLAAATARIELAEAGIQESASAIQETKTVLAKTVVRAPISGTIGRRNVEVGMQVSSNVELFTIGDLSRVRVEVTLTEDQLAEIRVGQPARVFVRSNHGGPRVLEAKISRISPFLDSVTRSTEAEIDVKNQGSLLMPGMSVTAEILYGESQKVTLVPTSAVYTNPETRVVGVYLIPSFDPEAGPVSPDDSDGSSELSLPETVEFRQVDVIAEGRMESGVRGVEPEQWVITVGQDLLSGGRQEARVRVSSWDRILSLQGLQREDLLDEVLGRNSE